MQHDNPPTPEADAEPDSGRDERVEFKVGEYVFFLEDRIWYRWNGYETLKVTPPEEALLARLTALEQENERLKEVREAAEGYFELLGSSDINFLKLNSSKIRLTQAFAHYTSEYPCTPTSEATDDEGA